MKELQYVTTLNCQKAEDIKQEIRKMKGRLNDHDDELIRIEDNMADIYDKWKMESERIMDQNNRLYVLSRRLKWTMVIVEGAYIWSVLWFIFR
jgi:predicted  nucleic acid-binding Zn-ribbon protein